MSFRSFIFILLGSLFFFVEYWALSWMMHNLGFLVQLSGPITVIPILKPDSLVETMDRNSAQNLWNAMFNSIFFS